MSPFNTVARTLWDRKYSIVPIMPNGKVPAECFYGTWSHMTSWDKFCKTMPSENEVTRWSNWNGTNIGVATGEASYLVALDFDEDDEGIHKQILDVLPHSPVRKVGARGFTIFFQYNGEKSRTWRKNKKTILELLSTGRQTVLPPSIHPSGSRYHYTTEDTLETVNAADLPTLPNNFIELMDGIFGIVTRTKEEYKEYHGDTSVEEVEKALAHVSSENYQDWIEMGMSLSAELGDAGFAIWDKWSQGSAKYKAAGMRKKYESFRGQGIGIGSLFHAAMLQGYTAPPSHTVYDDPFEVDPNGFIGQMVAAAAAKNAPLEIVTSTDVIEEIVPIEPVKYATNIDAGTMPDIAILDSVASMEIPSCVFEDDVPTPETNLKMPHGLVGEIVDYMNRTAIRKQPELAIAAALAFVGMVKGHRLQSQSGIRSNFYAIGLGESGCGKEHPKRCIGAMIKAAGLEKNLMGNLVSGPGLLKALKNADGRAITIIDEIGLFMSGINGHTAQSHQKDILTNIMKLYSSTGQTFVGAEYANGGMRNDIEDPCFSIFGLSTAGRFWDSLNGAQVIDGFLNRILVIASDDKAPKKNRAPEDFKDVPQNIIDKILALQALPTNTLYEPGMITGAINPRRVYCNMEAQAILDQFDDHIDEMYDYAYQMNDKTYPIWVRTTENAIKVALILQEGEFINAMDMKWACDFVYKWTVNTIKNIKTQISDSPYEKSINSLIEIIRKYQERNNGEGIPHGVLSRSTSKWLKMKERNDMINSLLDAETIYTEQELEGHKVKRYFIREV